MNGTSSESHNSLIPSLDLFSSETLLQNKAALYALTSFLFAALVIIFRRVRTKTSRGNALLLVGSADAGKTAILSSLLYGQTLPSHTSLQVNASVVTLPSVQKIIKVVDIPGHPRVRGQFTKHLTSARAIAFVVDSSTISRNGDAVAEHLHLVLHELVSLPPSQPLPALLILAHKIDLLKGSAMTDNATVAIQRVRTVLERELSKRRQNQSNGVGIEGLGEEDADRSEWGGLECSDAGGMFKFDGWEGGEISFLATSVAVGKPLLDEKTGSGLAQLTDLLEENF